MHSFPAFAGGTRWSEAAGGENPVPCSSFSSAPSEPGSTRKMRDWYGSIDSVNDAGRSTAKCAFAS